MIGSTETSPFSTLLSGTKIVSVAYGEDSVVEGQDMEGVTSMDLDPPVGMVCLYRWMGIDSFPPKPEEDQV